MHKIRDITQIEAKLKNNLPGEVAWIRQSTNKRLIQFACPIKCNLYSRKRSRQHSFLAHTKSPLSNQLCWCGKPMRRWSVSSNNNIVDADCYINHRLQIWKNKWNLLRWNAQCAWKNACITCWNPYILIQLLALWPWTWSNHRGAL